MTGDLTNIGLPQEHINALAWLKGLGVAERVSVIPGNHDIYSRLGRDPGTARWAAYMASDVPGARHADHGETFPFVRMLGPVAIIGSDAPTLHQAPTTKMSCQASGLKNHVLVG